jgi:hypothetical protein
MKVRPADLTVGAMLRRVPSAVALAVLAVALPAALAPPAGAASALRVSAVAPPAHAHAGGALPVRVTVGARRRARGAALTLLLSKDRRRSREDTRLSARARVPAARRRGRLTLTADAVLPARAPTGARHVLACLGRACAASRTRVTITASADPGRASAALIEADRRAGRLSEAKAVTFRVLALFGDPRLPARYAGDAGAGDDHGALREAANAWSTLPKSARRMLSPYLLPPAAKGSWYARARRGASAAQYEQTPDECETDRFRKEWNTRSAAGGRVKLHWPKDRPQAADMAKDLAWAAHLAYGHHKRVMGREPLSDATSSCFHGPDGALDIYLVENVPYAEGYTIPVDKTTYTTPECDGMASFIVMDEGHPRANFSRRFTLAHELFHAFQNAFPYAEGCQPYEWFDEGAANWAAHATFPDDQSEHFFEWGITTPDTSLTLRDYHTWPFMLWMEKTQGEASIRRTYEAFAKSRSLAAIDRAIGLRRTFLDFARHAWNQKPLEPSFVAWDKLALVPERGARPIPEERLFLAGQRARTANVRYSLSSVARDYFPFAITDEKVRELTFRNPLAGNPDARIGAILTFRGGATRFEDWSGRQSVRFCRDEPGGNLDKIVLVYANASTKERDSGIDATPQLDLKDRCAGFPWHFKVKAVSLRTTTSAARAANDDHICGSIAGIPISGEETFTVAGADLPFDPQEARVEKVYGGALSGSVSAKAPARWSKLLRGCEDLFDAPRACSTTVETTPRPDGTWPVGFSLRAASKDAPTATLTWSLPDPDPGYFDADDSVCNVFSIWKALDAGQERQEVPLSRLAGTAPFTLTFDGDATWTADQQGRPARIAYSWRYSMTLQRVDESGAPL